MYKIALFALYCPWTLWKVGSVQHNYARELLAHLVQSCQPMQPPFSSSPLPNCWHPIWSMPSLLSPSLKQPPLCPTSHLLSWVQLDLGWSGQEVEECSKEVCRQDNLGCLLQQAQSLLHVPAQLTWPQKLCILLYIKCQSHFYLFVYK